MASAATMNVPFLDLKEQNRRIWPELQQALDGVISQSQFILGPAVERFEKAFAAYFGRKFCVGLNNGTSALHMALQACDVGPGRRGHHHPAHLDQHQLGHQLRRRQARLRGH